MKCPICATEVANTVTSCPVCGRIMEAEQPAKVEQPVKAEQPADSDAFSIDDVFKPIPVEISQSEILKSMMQYNAQPKEEEEEAPQLKEEAVAPEQEQQIETPKSKGYSMRTDSKPKDYNPHQNMSAQGQPVIERETPEQKKKTPIIMKLGQFVKLRHA